MLRPAEILYSYADVLRAAKALGWTAKNARIDVVRMMLDARVDLVWLNRFDEIRIQRRTSCGYC
jgi:GDP-D-mannose dehydratase